MVVEEEEKTDKMCVENETVCNGGHSTLQLRLPSSLGSPTHSSLPPLAACHHLGRPVACGPANGSV